ncbi:putative WD repeat-containing protein alr3466 [Nostoc sp, PCC 7120] [Rhizoctonia solani]|uniref:Putative WD repeat-containing protein alr3466 [Nostoc sp, PCC 7120] n=1 Tax=Rhizoctonia solani TaxID=456999 RepID=A0A0K6G840_9AGAM|nr:putative WD repeat-containing protein alr3466 [Nostoc sp, PCC 7120] [Rhizoctonia solani]
MPIVLSATVDDRYYRNVDQVYNMSLNSVKESISKSKDKWKKRLHIGSTKTSPLPSTQESPQVASSALPELVIPSSSVQDSSKIALDEEIQDPLTTSQAGDQPGKSDLVWPGVKALLAVLESSSKAFGPLKSAISGLNECIDIYENAGKEQEDFVELRQELEVLSKDLKIFVAEQKVSLMTDSVKQICSGIEAELSILKNKQSEKAGRRLFEMINRHEQVTTFSRRIQGYMQRLSLNANASILKAIDDLSMESRLTDMLPAKPAIYNSAESEELQRGACTPGTREPQIELVLNWARNQDAGQVCWMNGMAGTGKTTIAYSVCAALEESSALGASFFCSRTIQECRQVKNIIPTIAYQLARASMPFRSALVRTLESTPDAPTLALNVQYRKLIAEPLLEVEESLEQGFIVVIDALDECENEESLGQVLDLLVLSELNLSIRFLVSSRPEREIHARLAINARLVLHDLDSGSVKSDIEAYMRDKLKNIPLTDAHWPGLLERCGVLFIYASTTCRYIEQGHRMHNLDEAVATILGSAWMPIHRGGKNPIDDLYSTILTAAFDESKMDPNSRERMKGILETVICAQVPMSLQALAGLLDLKNADQANALLQSLRSVLNITPGTSLVTTLHASFPDYMLSRERSGEFYCAPEAKHSSLAKSCLQIIDRVEPKFNICGLTSSYLTDDEVNDLNDRVSKAISPGLLYASQYWSTHLGFGNFQDELVTAVYKFLSENLLLWMEVLNLTKHMRLGASIIQRAEKWCSVRPECHELVGIARDAGQFVSVYAANPVCQSTPHIYVSMLPFWPRSRPVSEVYKSKTRGLLIPTGSAIARRQLALIATWKVSTKVSSIGLSSDGTRIAAATENAVDIVDTSTGEGMFHLQDASTKRIAAIAMSPSSTQIAFGSRRGAYLLDLKTETARHLFKPDTAISSIVFSPNGSQFAIGLRNGNIHLYASQTGEIVCGLVEGHTDYVRALAFSPNGLFIASGSDDSTVRVWDVAHGQIIGSLLEGHTDIVLSISYSPDGTRLALASIDGTIRVWDPLTGQTLLGPLRGHSEWVYSVTFSPNGAFIASGSLDRAIRVYDAQSGQNILGPLQGHTNSVKSVIFSPDSTRLYSCSDDGTIRLWNVQDPSAPNSPQLAFPNDFRSVQYSPAGLRAVSASSDGSICIWDVQTGDMVLGPLRGHFKVVWAVDFSPDGVYIASASRDRTLRIWSAQDGGDIHGPMQGHTEWVRCVRFSPDGVFLVSGSDDHTVRIWDVATGLPTLEPFRGHSGIVLSVAFSPNGAQVVSGSDDCTIRVWDTNTGQIVIGPLQVHKTVVSSVEFCPDGSQIISGLYDGSIQMWDAQAGQLLYSWGRDHTAINSLSFSPDGLLVVSGSNNNTTRIWDAQNGRLLHTFHEHFRPVWSVWFSLDGSQVISCSSDGVIWIWKVSSRISYHHSNGLKGPNKTQIYVNSTLDTWSLNDYGWIVNTQQQRLVWVPEDLRVGLLRHPNDVVICKQGVLKLDFDGINIGKKWTECLSQ